MRRLLPQTLPGWVLLVVIAGLLAGQVTTLYIVARDPAASSDIVDYYRLNDRAFSLVQLLYSATPEERRRMASGVASSNYAMTVSDTPAVASAIAQDDELAELEDILVGRLSKFGVTEARVRREPASLPDRPPRRSAADSDVGEVEKDLLALAAGFARSDKLTASIQFADGQWLNFTEPILPPGPVLSLDSLPLYGIVAGLVVVACIWSLRRLTAPYRVMERAVKRLGEDLKSPPIAETGSREIRAAAHAINTMQARLREYVEDREQLAAAGGSLVFSGDTTHCPAFVEAVNAIADLRHLIIETSFENALSGIAKASKHHWPASLAVELAALTVAPRVWITHLKPGNEAAIMHELRAAAPGWGLEALAQGQTIAW